MTRIDKASSEAAVWVFAGLKPMQNLHVWSDPLNRGLAQGAASDLYGAVRAEIAE